MSLRMGSNQRYTPRGNALDRKVPRNPRYADIQSKVKTGMTVDKLTFVTTRQHLRRQDEPYYRLAPSQLHELLSEYEQDRQEGVHDFRDHIDPDHHGPKVVVHEADAQPSYERPYLILDVRTPAEFRRCHVTQARSFEGKLLNQDHMTPELYMYKNKEGGLVVLYCNDEREACHAATTLIHRGFDNVFVLSHGIISFARSFQSFVEGDIDALPLDVGQQKATTLAKSLRRSGHRHLGSGGGGSSISGSVSARDSTNGSVASSVYSKRNGAHGSAKSKCANINTMHRMGRMKGPTSSSSTRPNNNECHHGSDLGGGTGGGRGGGGRGGGVSGARVYDERNAPLNGGNDGMHNSAANRYTGFGSSNDDDTGQQQQQRGMLLSARGVAESNPPPMSVSSIGSGGSIPSGGNIQDTQKMQVSSTMHAPCRRPSPGRTSCRDSEAYSVGGESSCGGRGGGGGGGGWQNSEGSFSASVVGASGRELAEIVTAASATDRRGFGGGPGRDVSRGSATSVADSVISRATARRGRW